MKNLEELISKIGLSSTEATLYLSGIRHGEMAATHLSKQTGIKRPTVYHALESLLQKGLVSKKGVGSRKVFTMTPPDQIKHLLDQKIELIEKQKASLDELIPLLKRKNESRLDAIEVKQFEGIDGIKLVIEEALYCKSHHWDIIAPRRNFLSEFDEDYAQYYLSARKRRRIVSRSLWEEAYRSITPELVAERNPRYLPEVMHGLFHTLMILFDEKVVIISSYQTHSAILIESKEIHGLMSALFEGLWSVSKNPRVDAG